MNGPAVEGVLRASSAAIRNMPLSSIALVPVEKMDSRAMAATTIFMMQLRSNLSLNAWACERLHLFRSHGLQWQG